MYSQLRWHYIVASKQTVNVSMFDSHFKDSDSISSFSIHAMSIDYCTCQDQTMNKMAVLSFTPYSSSAQSTKTRYIHVQTRMDL